MTLPLMARRARLHNDFFFDCACERCVSSEAVGLEEEAVGSASPAKRRR
jgi:hypothetical protein